MEKTAYWQYLKNSLDIDDFMVPAVGRENVAGASSPSPLTLYNSAADLAFFASGNELPVDEKILFEKMILAMGLTLDKVGLFLSTTVSDVVIAGRIRVIFSDDVTAPGMGLWQDAQGVRVFTTHSLKNLLQNPDLKKSAWEHLKAVRSVLLQ